MLASVDELVTQAVTATGRSDFGRDEWRAPLEALVASLGHLTAAATPTVEAHLVRLLTNRLRVVEWWGVHPEVDAEEIDGPLLVLGLPRTGTTALVGMLASDPGFRSLRVWEGADPIPPPDIANEANDPRRIAAAAQRELLAEYAGEIMKMHLIDPLGPEEPHDVLGMCFLTQYFTGVWPARSFGDWWLDHDLRAGFAFERRVLQTLQSRRPPNRWLMKAPYYLFHLDNYIAVNPDARFVMTHRDPADAIPSQLSLIKFLLDAVTDSEAAVGAHLRWLAELWAVGMQRGLEARDRIGEDRFCDVHHHDLVADPMREIARIYEFLGRDVDDTAAKAIAAYTVENRSHKHGNHEYTAEQFGLTPGGIRATFAGYIDRFGLR